MSSNLQKYQNTNPLQRFLVKNFLKNVYWFVTKTQAKKVLEVGCGEGFVINYLLKKNSQLSLEGLDQSTSALEFAKKLNPSVNFYQGNVNVLTFGDNSYELILALEVLEHLESPTLALKELNRVTSKFCLISVPHEPFFSLANLFRGKNLKRLGQDPGHLQFWSRHQVVSLVKDYFNILEVRTPFPWTLILASK